MADTDPALGDLAKRAERVDKIILAEYDSLWSYYLRTLDEKNRAVENYLKLVMLPPSLTLGALFVLTRLQIPQVGDVSLLAFVMCVVISSIGTVCLTLYCKEHANSRNYLAALRDIRAGWKLRYPELCPFISIDDHRRSAVVRDYKFWTSIGGWRAGVISAPNAMITTIAFALAAHLGAYRVPWIVYVSFAIASLATHVFWSRQAYASYLTKI